MRASRLFALLSLSAVSAILSSCGGSGGPTGKNPGGTGPFNSHGDYVEAWADTPSKWGRKSSSTPASDDIPPMIAADEQPPSSAVPLTDTKPVQVTRAPSKPTRKGEVEVVSRQKPKSTEITSRPKPSGSSAGKPTKSRVSEETVSNKAKSKPKAVEAKPSKPKPSSPSRYVVKKGDSLYVIASRNKTSVSALQKANGISGTLIQPGQSLVIPR